MHILLGQSRLIDNTEQSPITLLQAEGMTTANKQRIATVLQARFVQDVAGLPTLAQWVLPRQGTVSPWSSRTLDIIAQAGIAGVTRIEQGIQITASNQATLAAAVAIQHDRMIHTLIQSTDAFLSYFDAQSPTPLVHIPLKENGMPALLAANEAMGLALSSIELDYLQAQYAALNRDPTDVELMMFAQVNSEHCRHKIFNARYTIDGKAADKSLFQMIKHTYETNPNNVLVAYHDNAAVNKGPIAKWWMIEPESKSYCVQDEPMHLVLKVETHNHPTAISPMPGAATGSGGEIRDESATGRGATPKAGLCGFTTSHLHIPSHSMPWEFCAGKPSNIASAYQIMMEAPIGAARFNNEFGRPALGGYFRTFEMALPTAFGEVIRGYHKPIMIAGGVGSIREESVNKCPLVPGALLVVLGGPALPIGLGGGAASSVTSGENEEALDFASVQRANPEMERRAQEVINACWRMVDNIILSIHDVGAGGISNALPELVAADNLGAQIDLDKVPSAASGMTPLEIWCNESQERYVLAIAPESLVAFEDICMRERAPFAVVGQVTKQPQLIVTAGAEKQVCVDLPMAVLFGKLAPMERSVKHESILYPPFKTGSIDIDEAVLRVLSFPAVASKSFLITIGDRSVTGLVARDQMVGPWQVPVSDVAVTASDYWGVTGAAMAMGERSPIALIHHAASARMAVGEALTNIAASYIGNLNNVILSANWMAATGYPGEDAGLYDAVRAVGEELCPALGINIPVGKDSLSMRTQWEEGGQKRSVTSPLSLIVTAAAPVIDVRKTLTPQLKTDQGETNLLLIDLSAGAHQIAGSVLAQVYGKLGQRPADLDKATLLKSFFNLIQSLNADNKILAYHDRSDGGLLATVCEMMFASHVGVTIRIDAVGSDPITNLFSEELGAVLQIKREDKATVMAAIDAAGLSACAHMLGVLNDQDRLEILYEGKVYYSHSRIGLQQYWESVSMQMSALRDDQACAKEAEAAVLNPDDPGLTASLTFDLRESITAPFVNVNVKPRCAILREQGVNGHMEMAAAFYKAGFDTTDVTMQALQAGAIHLKDFQGMAACGGFSYGDVLGAGRGWANSILYADKLRDEFTTFFNDTNTFTLGVCNGCQMLSHLKSIIPGADDWPQFLPNRSNQFEARLVMAEVLASPSLFMRGMEGSQLPIVVSHGEGRVEATDAAVSMRYINHLGQPATQYPANPNGSEGGATAFTNTDGRITIMMPHPERIVRSQAMSWHPPEWGDDSPWLRLFKNARCWVG